MKVMMLSNGTLKLRVVVLKGELGWIAQCLELDLCAQGERIPDALRALVQTVIGQAMVDFNAGKAPFADFKPAPRWYFDQYESKAALNLVPPEEILSGLTSEPVRAVADVRIAA